jgi:hypothetical protein
MDFIIKLPPLEDLLTKIKIDIILAIVDRLSKYAMFILYLESTTAEQLADIIIRELVSKFGMPEEFITNRDKLFTLNMWQSLIDKLGVHYKLLTSFYP